MSGCADELVTKLRMIQWEADSVAYSLPYDDATRYQCDTLADAMEHAATKLREVTRPVVETRADGE